MCTSIKTTLTFIFLLMTSMALALECPAFPQQASKDLEVEVKAAVVKIGPAKGGELSTRTKNVTKDLMSKLPDAGRLYLEQMMYAGYCSALKAETSISEGDKAKQLQDYAREVRKALSSPQNVQKQGKASQPKSAEIKLVDLSIVHKGAAPTLDIKVRNNSAEVVFVKRAEIQVLGQWDMPNQGYPKALPVSATYGVKISPKKNSIYSQNISQEITPNTADRFEISLVSDHAPYPHIGIFAYLIKVKLIYNENDAVLELPPVLVHIQTAMEIEAYSPMGPPPRTLAEQNKKVAQDLLKTIPKETIIQNRVEEAIKSWASADLERLPN